MEAEDSKPVLALKRLLQKYVKRLLSDFREIQAKESESKKEVSSLANLLEQRDCAVSVDVLGSRLASIFPDVKPRLLVKLSAEVDNKVEKLRDQIGPLREHSSVAYSTRVEALKFIHKSPSDLTMDVLTSGQPTIPPLMVMLDWIDAVERQTREIYHTRLYYLENILDKEVISSETLVTMWFEDVPALVDTVKDCEEQSVYFLEEKYD